MTAAPEQTNAEARAIEEALDWCHAADHPLSQHKYEAARAALAALVARADAAVQERDALRGDWPEGSDVADLYARGDPLSCRAADTIVGATQLRKRWRHSFDDAERAEAETQRLREALREAMAEACGCDDPPNCGTCSGWDAALRGGGPQDTP